MPYTVSIYNPSYATIVGNAWNWGASGAANNGVISGPLTAVSITLAMLPCLLLCAQNCLQALSQLLAFMLRVTACSMA